MSNIVPAFDYLKKPEKWLVPPVCVLYGDDQFLIRESIKTLQSQVLTGEDAEFSFSRREGNKIAADKNGWKELIKEVSTIALFGEGRRLVLIEAADPFVTAWRTELESYVVKPAEVGVLALILKEFPSNTNLYKKTSVSGLLINCQSKAKTNVPAWLSEWSATRLQIAISPKVTDLLIELVGDDLGVLEQEIRRLGLLSGGQPITNELVSQNVGSWRIKKIWDLIDAVLDGKVSIALQQLDQLLASGEAPINILASFGYTLRRFATATQLFLQAERNRQRPDINRVLIEAGFKEYFIRKYVDQMIRLGRHRGLLIPELLIQADLDLKGASRAAPRLILERLIVQIAHPALKNPQN